jgi:hypothetical protein
MRAGANEIVTLAAAPQAIVTAMRRTSTYRIDQSNAGRWRRVPNVSGGNGASA